MTPTALYLDLMKKCLTHFLWGDTWSPVRETPDLPLRRRWLLQAAAAVLEPRGMVVSQRQAFDPRVREEGLDWPAHAHTMIGLRRLDNLQACIEKVLHDHVPGDLIETGVWRGGSTIFMRAVLEVYGVTDRLVWVADSFEGLPPPNPTAYPADEGDTLYQADELRVSLEDVKANFAGYGLLDDRVRFLKGWFRDTLPSAPIERLAVLRLDGDLYESTMDALVNLYPRVSDGGFVIVDDYALLTCQKAVHDFRDRHAITEPMQVIDAQSVFWRKACGRADPRD